MLIPRNGGTKVVTQGIDSDEQAQEAVVPLRNLVLGVRRLEAGQVQPAADVVVRLRGRRQPRSRLRSKAFIGRRVDGSGAECQASRAAKVVPSLAIRSRSGEGSHQAP